MLIYRRRHNAGSSQHPTSMQPAERFLSATITFSGAGYVDVTRLLFTTIRSHLAWGPEPAACIYRPVRHVHLTSLLK